MTRQISHNEIMATGDYSELKSIREYVRNHADNSGLSSRQTENIILAVDEACSNLIRYSIKFDHSKTIQIDVIDDKVSFTVQIIDTGKPFNPLECTDPNMKEYFKEFRKGGLGIKIIKSVVDKIEYKPHPKDSKENTLKLIVYK